MVPFGKCKSVALATATLALALTAALNLSAATVWLDDLDISKTTQDWGQAGRRKSVDGHDLGIGGKHFAHGVGTHARSRLYVDLKGGAKTFSASVGVDSEITSTKASVEFYVLGDGKLLCKTGVMRAGEPPRFLEANVAGVKVLALLVGDAGDGISYDHADWADAKLEVPGAQPETVVAPPEKAVIPAPPPPPTPRINGAHVFGVRPGHPFLFTIAATGRRPMTFSAAALPEGLQLDPRTGFITGVLSQPGEYSVTLHVKNKLGADTNALRIVCGDRIALTPPMGWNSWNCFAHAVDDAKVRSAADALVSRGLINHGWTYINIDDCWEGARDANGNILPNEKFPDMKALTGYVHSRGLKIGLYSSPGPKTCAGFEASWQHELADAKQYAAWGFDYLKYDWCSYDQVQDKALPDRERFMKPYLVMQAALAQADRDIVFSLCQYGMGNVWEWGAQVGGNCWRTTGDITDTWDSMANNGFNSAGREQFAGPGHWNDPDMLVVGRLGWGQLRPTRLTPNEQCTHISLWCLLSSPMLIGCDMAQLDPFTLSLLSNDEVLAVDQDPLGKQASRISRNGDLEVWAKDMEDGSKAIGLFNRGELGSTVEVSWSALGLNGKHRVRDLWRQKDLGTFPDSFSVEVPRHAVVLVRVW
jgi:alpha-galactosidase